MAWVGTGCRQGLAVLALLAGWFVTSPVFAQTDEIQVYDAQIAAPGVVNLTLHDNYTPTGRTAAAYPGGVVPDHALNGVPEWAYGVTDWFEAGLYLPLYSLSGNGALTYNGFKVRALFVAPDAANQPFFYGLNFEFSWNTAHWDPDKHTLEIRPIIGWHLGPFDLIVNPILDSGYNGFPSLDFAPDTRLAYNINKTWAAALEEYDDFGALHGSIRTASSSTSCLRSSIVSANPGASRPGSAPGSPPQPTIWF